MTAEETLERIRRLGIVAVVRSPTTSAVANVVDALVEGGLRGVEITYTTPGAPEALAALRERYGSTIVLGAGTLTRPHQAAEAVDAGARFLVCPGLDDELLSAMKQTGTAVMAGALTPTEVMRALRLGADLVKLFPASLGGPSFLRSLRGPFPGVRFLPTGGVSAESAADWLAAGAFALAAGSEVCPRADIETGRFNRIADRARLLVAAVERARVADC